MLNPFEASGVNEHKAKEVAVAATAVGDSKATALVSMTKTDKEKLTAIAKAYGLNLCPRSSGLPSMSTSRGMIGNLTR